MSKLTILIATKNRDLKIGNCIKSILLSENKKWKLIIIDQNDNNNTKLVVDSFNDKRIVYKKFNKVGKSAALNFGIKLAESNYIAFTDDDCIVRNNWVSEIISYLDNHRKIDGVFGNVYPYKPEIHENEFCPATIINKVEREVTNPASVHYLDVGSGNNMAYRREVFEKFGYFKSWLGPGQFIDTSEDGELIFRLLFGGAVLGVNPSQEVWHDRWITGREMEYQRSRYTRGFLAVFVYYFKSNTMNLAKSFIKLRVEERWGVMIRGIVKDTTDLVKKIYFAGYEGWMILSGLFYGLFLRFKHTD